MLEVLIREAGARFGLGAKALELVQMLLAYMTDKERGGLAAFLEPFKTAELGPIVQSWLGGGPSAQAVNADQLERVLGAPGGVIAELVNRVGGERGSVVAALGYLLPALVGKLTPGGNLPNAIPAEIRTMAEAGRQLLAQPASDAASGGGSWVRWLPWLIIAVLIIGALAYWGRSMSGGGSPSAAGPVTSSAASAAATEAANGDQSASAAAESANPATPASAAASTSGAADPAGAAVVVHDVAGQPTLNVYFATGSAELPANFAQAAAPFVEYMKEHASAQAVVAGFNDASGNASANAEISKQRALAVQSALVQGGADAARVVLEKPAETTATATTNGASRRVEVIIRAGT